MSDNFTLYELTEAYRNILDLIQGGEEDDGRFEEVLAQIEDPIEEKAEGYKIVMDRIQADIDMIRTEEKRLSDRRRTMERKIDAMKGRLLSAMQVMEMTKIKSKHFTFSIRKNPPSVQIKDIEALPFGFYSVEKKADKAKIREALKSGQDISGATLTQSESLQIR